MRTPTMTGFFADLEPVDREGLIAIGIERAFHAGSTLFHEGDESNRVMVLLEGRVRASYFSWDGDEVVLNVMTPGEILGALSAIDHEPRSATVTCLERVRVLVVPGEGFTEFVTSRPSTALVLMKTLSGLFRHSNRKRIEFGTHDTPGRVARQLVELAHQLGRETDDGTEIAIPLSHQELAAWVGASREGVGKAIQHFREQGLVSTKRRCITVVDLPGLTKRAE